MIKPILLIAKPEFGRYSNLPKVSQLLKPQILTSDAACYLLHSGGETPVSPSSGPQASSLASMTSQLPSISPQDLDEAGLLWLKPAAQWSVLAPGLWLSCCPPAPEQVLPSSSSGRILSGGVEMKG